MKWEQARRRDKVVNPPPWEEDVKEPGLPASWDRVRPKLDPETGEPAVVDTRTIREKLRDGDLG